MTAPDYDGGSLVNLAATLEERLAGSTPGTPLADPAIPEATSYLLVLFDGLGDGQLAHPAAAPLAESRVAAIDTVFPATTTSAMASIATASAPAEHGLLGYEMWLPEAAGPINTIHWKPVGGGPEVDIDFDAFLPRPNMWERLAAAGYEPITVQPAQFQGSPMSRVLYRGCRYEPVDTYEDWIEASLSLAAEPGRLVFSYFGAIDVTAHLRGQESPEYLGAVRLGAALWNRLKARKPGGVALVGTADHGHVDVEEMIKLDQEILDTGHIYGDGRVLFSRSDIAEVAQGLPAHWVDRDELAVWFGSEAGSPVTAERMPAGALVADDGVRLLHQHSDGRLVGVHGALSEAERRIPVLLEA